MGQKRSPEYSRSVLAFPAPAGVVAERGGLRPLLPEQVGTILVYRYYQEVGNTYPVEAAIAPQFLGYIQLLSNMYDLPLLDGQPDKSGQVREKFLLEPELPEGTIAENKRFCAVLQLGENGYVQTVSFRALPNKPVSSATSPKPRLRIVK